MLQKIINWWRGGQESEIAVLGYASHSIDEIWIRSTLTACARSGINTALAWSNGDIPAEIIPLYTNAGIALYQNVSHDFMQQCPASVVVTASSGLNKDWFSKKHCQWRIHMPHSIASLHMIYPEDAFDGYNVLFSVGPHHDKEFNALSKLRNLGDRLIFPCGYGKLDVLKELRSLYTNTDINKFHILLAPSWGKENILNVMGKNLIRAMLDEGYFVTLRPHPLFFLEQDPLLGEYEEAFSHDPNYCLENSLGVGSAIFSADILLSDYSGTVQEFTTLTGNPAVFIDVPAKVVNENWEKVNLQPIELASRNNLGPLSPSNVPSVMKAIENIQNNQAFWRDQVRSFSAEYLHEGICADNTQFYIEKLLSDISEKGGRSCH